MTLSRVNPRANLQTTRGGGIQTKQGVITVHAAISALSQYVVTTPMVADSYGISRIFQKTSVADNEKGAPGKIGTPDLLILSDTQSISILEIRIGNKCLKLRTIASGPAFVTMGESATKPRKARTYTVALCSHRKQTLRAMWFLASSYKVPRTAPGEMSQAVMAVLMI